MSPSFKKISFFFITAFLCLSLYAIPQKADAALATTDVGGYATEYSGWDSQKNEPYTSTGDTLYEWMSEPQYASQRKNPDNETPAAIASRVHSQMYTLMNNARTAYNEAYTNAKIRTQSEDAEWNGYIDEWQLDVTDENKKYVIAYTEAAMRLYEYQKAILDKHGFAGDDADASEINERLRMNKEILAAIKTYEAGHGGSIKGFNLDQNMLNNGLEIRDPAGNVVTSINDSGEIFCWKGLTPPTVSVQGCIGLGLYYGLLKPSSWVLWAAGVAFNYSIDFTLNFGKFIRDQGLGKSGSGAIYLGWSAIRDLINVGFIFILLYAAISTIVGLDGYGVKKTVVKVVIAALLLNFSLFFTKALIDMSNLIALQFYTRVLTAADQASYGKDFVGAKSDDWDSGLSIGFVNALGLKSIWGGSIRNANSSGAGEANSAFGSINAGQLIIICLGGSAFILVTAFTLFMATLRFLYRSIVLIFLMILSPIGFVGGAIPALKGAAGKWQSRLKNNLIFAPAYMAIFYVVALIVFGKGIGPSQVDVNSGAGLTGFGALFQGNVSSTGLLFWFVMIIGLMMGTQIAADQFADKMGMADSFKKKAKGWAAGAMAMAPRRVLGGTADALIKNTAVKAVLARVPGGGIVMSGLDKVRGAKMFGSTSFKDKMKEDQKKTEERAKLFKEGRELTQYRNESDKAFEARKKFVKKRATNAASAYLGMGGPLGLFGKSEVKKEDLAEAGKTGRLVQATRYIPIIGSSLEKMRRKNQAARKTVFEGDREEKDKALKSELETKLATAINDLEVYSSSVAYKNETTAIQTRVDQAKELVKNSVTAAELATHNATLRREMKALNAHTKEAKALEKQIREFKDKISQIDSRKKDGK